jgi:hypothetical protein
MWLCVASGNYHGLSMLVLSPNFDVGGTADAKRVETAFRIKRSKRKSDFD